MYQNDFPKRLIKGRIAENIFELMFRESGKFDVIPLGYEHITPELAQYQHFVHVKEVIDNIRNIPDFALVSKDKTEVYFVEVKYRSNPQDKEIKEIAEKIAARWQYSFLFLATPHGFYFESTEKIKENNGKINLLHWIDDELQKRYLKLLRDFILLSDN